MIRKKITALLLGMVCTVAANANVAYGTWGTSPEITVVGNHLEDPNGNQVMLHGIMDTPSPYFSGYRWGSKADDTTVQSAIDYFDKLFTAATDTTQGSFCNVFRLHLDPCWTNDPTIQMTGSATGEANISQFSNTRLEKYLKSLFQRIASKAKGHGMYVIMRPPGVCPEYIKVGDEYQKYLLTVWKTVARNSYIKANYKWISLELANEPRTVLDAQGKASANALHDFFQPIVDMLRDEGFKGIIWIPGSGWQQNYQGYAEYPITDKMYPDGVTLGPDGKPKGPQIGYAVHFYPGWFSTSDSQYDPMTTIRSFKASVPVVKTNPIMITEVDWSPENPNGTAHQDEWGNWVKPNYGTWATGTTSKFGYAYRAMVDYFGNIGWTLTHTHDYMDIDTYLATGKMQPAFTGKLADTYEACSGACFKWYNEYAHTVHKAMVWDDDESSEMFPLTNVDFNPNIWEKGTFNESTGMLKTGQYGFGGWQYSVPLNLSEYNYVVVEMKQTIPNGGQWSPSFRLFSTNSYWSSPYSTNLGGKKIIAIPLKKQKNEDGTAFDPSHVYIAGFWTMGAEAIYIDRVFVSNDGISPATGAEDVVEDALNGITDGRIYNINGMKMNDATRLPKGIYVRNGKKFFVK